MLIENNEAFLSELTKLFHQNQAKDGSLYLTMKRYDGRTKPIPRKRDPSKDRKSKGKGPQKGGKQPTAAAAPSSSSSSTSAPPSSLEYKCLIRAQMGKKKISTVIAAKDVNKFQLAYSNLLKGNLYGLKKKVDKKKADAKCPGSGSKAKATQ
jgi:signal recognition particle subunit SRP14